MQSRKTCLLNQCFPIHYTAPMMSTEPDFHNHAIFQFLPYCYDSTTIVIIESPLLTVQLPSLPLLLFVLIRSQLFIFLSPCLIDRKHHFQLSTVAVCIFHNQDAKLLVSSPKALSAGRSLGRIRCDSIKFSCSSKRMLLGTLPLTANENMELLATLTT